MKKNCRVLEKFVKDIIATAREILFMIYVYSFAYYFALLSLVRFTVIREQPILFHSTFQGLVNKIRIKYFIVG